MRRLGLCLMMVVTLGCTADRGGSPRPGSRLTDGGPTPVDPGTLATITGTVWAPGNAPGRVPAGQDIPVFDALVRVLPNRPEAIPDGAYCEPCVAVSGQHATTDHQGYFTVSGINPGDYWVVVEKGQFRIETQISLVAGETRELTAEATTLPSIHDPANGRWVPHIAIATGSYDDLQDVLGKMGIGGVNASGAYTPDAGSERIDFYSNGGPVYRSPQASLAELVSNLATMLQYHIIFIPCSGRDNTGALDVLANLRNIRDYVAAGGKLYVTDWSGEWMDNVFPAFVELENSAVDTPAAAYDAASNTWNTGLFGSADGSSYNSNNAEAVDPDLNAWLDGQAGPSAEDPSAIIPFDPNYMDVVGNWNEILNTPPVQIGVDNEGLPLYDVPLTWVVGGRGVSTPKRPLTVTFEPAGCGRVLYSTYHTTETTHSGLAPQERILLYLIMEIGVCIQEPIVI